MVVRGERPKIVDAGEEAGPMTVGAEGVPRKAAGA